MPETVEILSIELNKDVHLDDKLYRIKRGSIIRLVPGTSLLGFSAALNTNFPAQEKAVFDREHFATLKWHIPTGQTVKTSPNIFTEITSLDIYCEIKANRAGSFKVYITFEGLPETERQGSVNILIEPQIRVGPIGAQKIMPLDSIRCQTVMSKCLGPLSTWEAKLRVTKESGYNLIHFTPVQELGGSRSGYSLRDQLKVNSQFGKKATYDDVAKIIQKCRQEWGIASICDIVLNHTANESDWLQEHPEATYSCDTCPHMRPAFLLDAAMAKASEDVGKGLLEHVGVPAVVETEHHLEALKYQLHIKYLEEIKIPEFYCCDIEKYLRQFKEEVQKRGPPASGGQSTADRSSEIVLIPDPEFHRHGTTINFELALEIFNIFRPDCYDEDSRQRRCAEAFRNRLEHINESARSEIQNHLNGAVDNCIAGTRYERVQHDGPNVREISIKYPLFQVYFTRPENKVISLEKYEEMMYTQEGKFFMAHNGWVMNGDPLNDFARPQTGTGNVYLRRELISWGDSVKLRFGDKPEDSSYLWQHMKDYVDKTAQMFDGVRLDNCHSTPLHVAEYLLDSARKVNPELYVVAELFTNSDGTDNIFVNRLGITSLIREALSAWDSHEEGRLVYRYGGSPVGAFYSSPKRIFAPGIAHALFLDLTHDNPSPVQKRSVFDLLPSAGLVSMACCATGSNRGYDELVPHHIHVVDEERQYQEWGHIGFKTGIIAAKRALNLLHGEMAEQGFSQVFVDQMHPDIVAVTRHQPHTHQSVILVAHTAFSYPNPTAGPTNCRPLRFEGNLEEIIFEADLVHTSTKPFSREQFYEKDEKYINGINEYQLYIAEHIPLSISKIFSHEAHKEGNITQLNFANLRPGSMVAVRVSLEESVRPHVTKLQNLISQFHTDVGTDLKELQKTIGKMNLIDLNRALYRCDQEEQDMGSGIGAYNIPGFGSLVYCGFQGFISLLTQIAPHNDLGHPFCTNLRNGDWMIDYVQNRLQKYPGTEELAKWLTPFFESLKKLPRYLIPSYFDVIVNKVCALLKTQSVHLMTEFIQTGSTFIHQLALGSVQCTALCPSADLPKLSPATQAPKPGSHCATLSAGLPHFSTGYMRCWGRDTFITLRGLLFLCGRYDEARYMILGFGCTMRHGLIPNLLDSGLNPRFNCRDAVWWWLHCIKQYVNEAPNGEKILSEKVSRMFPTDESDAKGPGEVDQPLYDIIQDTMKTHFQGLLYRERNAGQKIDAHMMDRGFNNQIGIHPETGFVFGGNEYNCGTWMDKMGSSDKAGNRGKPSTPRDGSAVELVGLQMASLRFLEQIAEKGVYPYKNVTRSSKNGSETTWTWKEWADKIKANFETHFFVAPEDKHELANKKSIYKDTVGSVQPWTDWQLRCNFPTAMVVAPELFNPQHAWEALNVAKKYLVGPLGMKTLDPDDWAYHGHYDNSNDSTDPSIAHGANYHQGPEWVWPIGFYLRARLIFGDLTGHTKEARAEVWSTLQGHLNEIRTSLWRGLPELTNANGDFCSHSCRTQAWSMATVLETLYDLNRNN